MGKYLTCKAQQNASNSLLFGLIIGTDDQDAAA